MNPRVSVIIPCYNQAQFLSEAVRSVLDQTYREVEIIVVDDGSTDDTAQVAAGFGRTILCIQQENSGLSAARNTGIRAATGEYMAFLDADDLWLPDFLKVLVPILDSDQNLGAVYCGSRFVDISANPLPQVLVRTVPADRLHDTLTDGDFFPVHSVLARKKVVGEVGLFDETLSASEDWDMWLRLSARYPFAGTARILALYRMHGDNMTSDLSRMFESQLQVVWKHFGRGEGDPSSWPTERRRAFAAVHLWQSLAYYQRNEPETAMEYVKRAFIAWPGLAKSLDVFYALGCADQPVGYVGDVKSLNLERSAANLYATLTRTFADPSIPPCLRSTSRVAYAMAYYALGKLAYRKRNLRQTRRYLAHAAIYRPILLLDKLWSMTFVKAHLGVWLLGNLAKWKRARTIIN